MKKVYYQTLRAQIPKTARKSLALARRLSPTTLLGIKTAQAPCATCSVQLTGTTQALRPLLTLLNAETIPFTQSHPFLLSTYLKPIILTQGSQRSLGFSKPRILQASLASAKRHLVRTSGLKTQIQAAFAQLIKSGDLKPTSAGWVTHADRHPKLWDQEKAIRSNNDLLDAIKSHLPQIEKQLETGRSHGAEDLFYRFYYQSFKAYWIQEQTQENLKVLRSIGQQALQSLRLCSYLEEIITEGTNKTFEFSHNQAWTKHTRPLVEAWFHTREILALMKTYSELPEAPYSLPSGWAAILCVFRVR